VFAGHDDRHREDAADLVGEQGGAVDGPATVVEVGEIGDEDRAAKRDGVQAGAFAEGELEFVVGPRGGAAGSEKRAMIRAMVPCPETAAKTTPTMAEMAIRTSRTASSTRWPSRDEWCATRGGTGWGFPMGSSFAPAIDRPSVV
jgi:hypothetical protein